MAIDESYGEGSTDGNDIHRVAQDRAQCPVDGRDGEGGMEHCYMGGV